jgi:hypothetical protein
MKLFYDPMSTTCRPVTLLLLDQGIETDHEVIELFDGQHMTARMKTLPGWNAASAGFNGWRAAVAARAA